MPQISRLLLVVLVVTLLVLAPGTAVLAQIACGDTVGPGETVTLTADVGPCSASANDPAVRVVGPATFDLAGFRVLCDPNDPPTGVLVEGKSAKVMHGGVDSCGNGIHLEGDGKHKVEDIVSTRNDEGFQVDSDKNTLKRVAAVESRDDGFDVEGNGNKIEDAEAVGSDNEGFEVDGNGNSFKRIVASGNDNDGIEVDSDDNKIKDCRMTTNGGDGADLDGNGNKLEKCLASANGDGDEDDAGIEIGGSGNRVKKSLSLSNTSLGIRITAGSTNNLIKQNVALGHPTRDTLDENVTCGTNTWQKNKFGTSEADGVENPACIQ